MDSNNQKPEHSRHPPTHGMCGWSSQSETGDLHQVISFGILCAGHLLSNWMTRSGELSITDPGSNGNYILSCFYGNHWNTANMPNQPEPTTRDWNQFRAHLTGVAFPSDQEWLDDLEIESAQENSTRLGLPSSVIISCHAATRQKKGRGRQTRTAAGRILIIDDDHAASSITRRALEDAGFIVRTEDSPELCLEAIRAFRPDLLLLDMVMPKVDGLDVLDILEGEEFTRGLPVIILTGLLGGDAADSVYRARRLFLAKPISAKSLVHCIDQHLA